MNATSNRTSPIKKPVIVKVPVFSKGERFSKQQAEKVLMKNGFRPVTAAESLQYSKFRVPNR